MKFQIPFTLSSEEILKRKSKKFVQFMHVKKNSKLEDNLRNSDAKLTAAEYLAICYSKFIFSFLILFLIASLIFLILRVRLFLLLGAGTAIVVSGFILMNRLNYPKMFTLKKTREIEKNIIPAMQDMLVQLNSGIPIFTIISNIASSDYGEVSYEFKKAIMRINSGEPQTEAIENMGNRTSSVYFRRVLWQISNGMRAGSDMAIVIKEGINNLTKEQSIQIQNYGNRLNPIIMFYMLIAVIMPALGITFLTIIASMLNISGRIVNLIYMAIFVMVILLQITFLGIIRTRRPSLL
jgi:flagellar protein FlaJ